MPAPGPAPDLQCGAALGVGRVALLCQSEARFDALDPLDCLIRILARDGFLFDYSAVTRRVVPLCPAQLSVRYADGRRMERE